MANLDTPVPDVHPQALLLPWLVNGTLGAAEQLQMKEHLAGCAACRAELAELQVIGARVREVGAPLPRHDGFPALRSLLRSAGNRSNAAGALLPRTLGLRRLFVPTWLPAAAVTVILIQSGALIWAFHRSPSAGEVESRGVASPITRLRLTFRPTASEQDLRETLVTAHARLVAGPSVTGEYVVAIPTTDPLRVEQLLSQLRGRAAVVQSAERAP